MGFILALQGEGALPDDGEPPPGLVHFVVGDIHQLQRLGIAFRPDETCVLVLHLAPPLLDLFAQHVACHQYVQGLESCNHLRHAVLLRKGLEHLRSRYDSHMARLYHALDLGLPHVEYRLEYGGAYPVAAVYAEVLRQFLLERHTCGGRSGLEAHGHEYQIAFGLRCHPDRVLYGVYHSDVGPVGFRIIEGPYGGGHPHHVPEGTDRDAGARHVYGVAYLLAGCYAYRTTGSLAYLHPRICQHSLQAESYYRVLMSAADVHERELAVQGAYLIDYPLGRPLVPVLIHPLPPKS